MGNPTSGKSNSQNARRTLSSDGGFVSEDQGEPLMDDAPDVGDIVVIKHGASFGWGRVVAIDPENEKIVLVSWESIGLRRQSRANLQVVDITTDIAKEYIEYLYGGSGRYH